jgi:hypothetical protein
VQKGARIVFLTRLKFNSRQKRKGGHMLDEKLITKLEAWVGSNPESADTPFMNVSTGEEFTVRGLLGKLRASLDGKAQLSESLQLELNQIETWIGGLKQ